MALSHVCTSCGHSLTRVRAVLDRDYKLPIVKCPACNVSCVRRRHPFVTRSRAFLRFRRSIHQLVAMPILLGSLLGGSIWASLVVLDLLRAVETDWIALIPDLLSGRAFGWSLPEWMRGSGETLSPLVLGFTNLGAGAIAGFGLTHWRRALLPVAWLALWNTALVVPLVVVQMDRLICDVWGDDTTSPLFLAADYVDAAWNSSAASIVSLPIFVAGNAIGRVLTRVSALAAARRWKKRRRARRRLRESR
jgi:hypothetical protein